MKRFAPILLVLATLAIGVWQSPNIRDWWILRNYQPPDEIVAFAQSTTMTARATREFYLARPDLETKQTFAQNCPVEELSLVLGCYNGNRIYVLRVEKPELSKVMDVTAAHEMLHAAYADLSDKERDRVDKLLEEYYQKSASEKLVSLVGEYDRVQPGTRLNELHSLVGTQEKNIGSELETYYREYFNNRRSVVDAYLAYEGVFNGIKNQLSSLESSIVALKSQLTALEVEINNQKSQLDSINAQLDTFEARQNYSAYNALVPTQNNLVQGYNGNVATYTSLVAQHNAKVEQYNQIALEQNDLVNSLDATKFTPFTN